MATKIIWTDPALQDLDEIETYIAQDSPTVAESVVRRIFAAPRNLELFPRMGRVVPEFDDPTIPELIEYKYRIIYRIRDDGIAVYGVIHGARRLKPALRGRGF